ncbi:SDR family oxidoreductase [Daejeonella sp.]|uniref:SDR family oxidoreductase n=1 Tax=Daejeonella sp. TaxID=2805397 RepID=UPI0039831A82
MSHNIKGVISLLGCGWLGYPLAKSLISQGFTIRASTTTPTKISFMQNEGIDPYLVHFSDGVSIPDLKKFFNAEILIITIPPGRRNLQGFDNYRRMVQYVCREIQDRPLLKVILISSTSVYPDNNNVVDEFSIISPDTDSGKLMADTEMHLNKLPLKVLCLRLAGLVGPGRMPGRFFAGKSQIPNGFSPVNLIHLNDVIGIINCLVNDRNADGIYNGCAPSHPVREEFYTLAAEIEGLNKPDFIQEKAGWKVVSSSRIKEELNYKFEKPSLMDWLYSIRQG